MIRGRTWKGRALALLLACTLVSWGCTRTYIFHPNKVPTIDHGELLMQSTAAPHSPTNAYSIERIAVRTRAHPYQLVAPSQAQLDAIVAQNALDLQTVEIDVGMTGHIWRESGLAGAGVGMTLGLIIASTAGVDDSFGSDSGFQLLITSAFAFWGLLIGASSGALMSPAVVDKRFANE